MDCIKTNVGSIMIGDIEATYCDEIALTYNRYGLTIFVHGCYNKPFDTYIRNYIKNRKKFSINIMRGVKLGGIEPQIENNCSIESYHVESKQGNIVFYSLIIQKK